MKYLIAIASLLAAGTAFANAETISGTESGTGSDKSTISGFKVDLDALTWSPSFSETPRTFTLSSIAYSSGDAAHSNAKFYSGDLWAFIYEGEVAPNNASSLTAITVSTDSINWNSNSKSNSGTWSFSNVDLDFTKTYSILFSSSKESFVSARGSSGTGEGIRSTVTTGASAIAIANYNGSGFTTGNGLNVTLTGSISSIPEPSAFGLLAGVGALALVAARRRRRAK